MTPIKQLIADKDYNRIDEIWNMSEAERDLVFDFASEKINNEIILNADSKHTITLERESDTSYLYTERATDTHPEGLCIMRITKDGDEVVVEVLK